jgi:hypothetical protein
MPDALRLAIALICSVCGMAWLALAMKVHWQQVQKGAEPSARTAITLRCLGALALALSLGLCLAVDHGSMASLVWVMSLAAAALMVTFILSWRPRLLAWLVPWAR